ncbi:MAG TPA: disulfide isomerase DsbC N-terminal domain-containing protein, partial [Dissulfurispiraceae bacterium]
THSYAFPTDNRDCSKCHTLTKDEATALLRDMIPNLHVLEVRQSPVKSMWEVDLASSGQKGVVYVDYSKKYLLADMLDIKGKKNLTQERLIELTRVDASKIPLKNALVMGSKDAKHKVIVFDDPD